MTRIIDLSVSLRNYSFEGGSPQITRVDHNEHARRRASDFGFPPSDFPGGVGMATDRVTLGSHAGTHVDAPLHYGPLCEGKPAKSIDQVPLEWCTGPGFVIDVHHLPPAAHITADEVAKALAKSGHEVRPNEIALVHTGAAAFFDHPDYVNRHSGMDPDAVHWLLDRGVRMIGIDAWGLDRPTKAMVEDHRRGEPNALWPSHFMGRDREYLQIERLANLDRLPADGFTVFAFPVKIEGATAGWSRVVAMIEDGE